jgi:5-methylcytosine-specific restriction endonuclease McrA
VYHHEERNFDDPKYKKWRITVYARDGFACRMCGACGAGVHLQAHHIHRWADAPTLRYVVGNGITLCEPCHSLVKDKEDEFAPRFLELIKQTIKVKKASRDTLINIRIRMQQCRDTQS